MAEITVKDITTGSIAGIGVFDELMTSAQVRLDYQYKQNRIKGADYAKVYLGGMEAILMNSIQFVLGRQEASAKADLILEQILTEKEQRKLVIAQTSKVGKEEDLIDQQILKMIQEVLVMEGEVSMIPDKVLLLKAEVAKMGQEILVMKGEVSMIPGKLKLINAQADKSVKEVDLVTQQIAKTTEEVLVMKQQVLESIQKVEVMRATVWGERAKTNSNCDVFTEDYKPTSTCKDGVSGLVGMQIEKATHEGKLLAQKVITEDAQTNDFVDEGRIVSGVIGKQKALYQKQTDGFDRDAEQKLAKILVDTWNVRRTTDEGLNPAGTGLEDDQINNVLDVAKDGITASANDFTNGGISGNIEGVSLDIMAITDVLEDCQATFEGQVIIDNLPTVKVKLWEWRSPEGRDAEHQGPWKPNHTPAEYKFITGFWEPGDNPVVLKITLEDSNIDSRYNNREITLTKQFYTTATADGGCMGGGMRPTNAATTKENVLAAAYSKAHPEEHGMTYGTSANLGIKRTTEGHKITP